MGPGPRHRGSRQSLRPLHLAVNPRPASDEYDRVVTELCFAVREFATCDALRNMPSEAIKEFCARKWEMRNKKIRIETKSEMRKHYPRSPDYADSVAFAVELDFLRGRDRFKEYDVFSLLHYDE